MKQQESHVMQPEDEEIIYISKSELKRDMLELQALGNELVNLSGNELKRVPISENLSDAITLAHKIKNKHEAHRRQIQYIGKLMRSEEAEPIQAALDRIKNKHQQATREFHYLEELRDQLISEGDDAVQALLTEHPELERQKLRQLIRQANKEKKLEKTPKAAREIFQYLKANLPAS